MTRGTAATEVVQVGKLTFVLAIAAADKVAAGEGTGEAEGVEDLEGVDRCEEETTPRVIGDAGFERRRSAEPLELDPLPMRILGRVESFAGLDWATAVTIFWFTEGSTSAIAKPFCSIGAMIN